MARSSDAIGSGRFLRQYESVSKGVKDTLRAYLGDPSEDNTHDLRSSLRRMDAALGILPRRARREAELLEKYEGRCRKLLKVTSPIRDEDMLLKKLEAESLEPSISAIARKAKAQRKRYAADSVKAAWKLFDMKAPRLDSRMIRGLDARTRKVVSEIEDKVAKDLARTIASESRIRELHSLRKRCKMLRYTLELMKPTGSAPNRLRLLRSWQDSLGAIHDSDVTIGRLAREDSSAAVRGLLRAEKLKRHSLYLKFVRAHRRKSTAVEPKPSS